VEKAEKKMLFRADFFLVSLAKRKRISYLCLALWGFINALIKVSQRVDKGVPTR
jgi:hypothetical protein